MKKLVKKYFLRWISGILYFTGLTILIPLFFILAIMPKIRLLTTLASLILISVLLITAGVFLRYLGEKSLKPTLHSLSWTTLIPGIISIFVFIYGKIAILAFFNKYAIIAEPLVQQYLANIAPHTWILTISYIIIFSFLYYAADHWC